MDTLPWNRQCNRRNIFSNHTSSVKIMPHDGNDNWSYAYLNLGEKNGNPQFLGWVDKNEPKPALSVNRR